jgi:hypothetical protein
MTKVKLIFAQHEYVWVKPVNPFYLRLFKNLRNQSLNITAGVAYRLECTNEEVCPAATTADTSSHGIIVEKQKYFKD